MQRILLGQLGANGDCLYATILARQLRADYPDAEIVWAISSQCAGLLRNNPFVDHLWEIPIGDWSEHELMWRMFEREAMRRMQRRHFDMAVLSQIWPNNFQNFDGTVRSSILRAYGRPITVPIENVIDLADDEIDRVDRFAAEAGLEAADQRILFECSSKSGQSFVTPALAQAIAAELYRLLPRACVIFATHVPMKLADARSRYAGHLSIRETARLTHHCDLFVGSGSGLTVAASSTAASVLPMVQLLAGTTSVFASFAHDFEYFGLTGRKVLELTREDPALIARAIAAVLTDGPDTAIDAFDGRVPVEFGHYKTLIEMCLLKQYRFLDAAVSLMTTAERYGWHPDLVAFAQHRLLPNMYLDPAWFFTDNRDIRDRLQDAIALSDPTPKKPRWMDRPVRPFRAGEVNP